MARPKKENIVLRQVRRLFLRRVERARKRGAHDVAALNRRKANIVLRKIRHNRKVKKTPGLVWYDGKQVAGWIAEDLNKVRRAGRWRGVVVSGYRTPAYSEQLCYRMCGRPSCPGRCAGRSSNHSQGYVFPHGAIDVSDFYTFAAECRRLGLRLRNDLPADRVHFSRSGK